MSRVKALSKQLNPHATDSGSGQRSNEEHMSYEVQCEGRVAVTRSISRAVLGQASQTHMACGLRSPETMCVCVPVCVCVGGVHVCVCARARFNQPKR